MMNNNSIKRSTAIKEKFYQYFSAGHSTGKAATQDMLILQDRADGARIWDVDGKEFLDYTSAFGPNILGHRHPEYVESLKEFLDSKTICIGASFGISEDDVIAAEKLITHIPCAERIKFTVSGTEAIQTAIRIARSYTGRPYVLQFKDHYHGWIDNVFGYDLSPDQKDIPYAIPRAVDHSRIGWSGTHGRGPGAGSGTLMLNWNDIDALENALKHCGEEIAIILMEPFACNAGYEHPRPGYLQKVRELCDQYGIILCFDEIITGFRLGLNGAQGIYGVTPDMCTLGKSIGGGISVAAVAGKSAIIDILKEGNTVGAGTYMGNPLSMRAVRKTLEILERDNGEAYRIMEKVQKPLMNGLDEIARRRGIPMRVEGFPGAFATLLGVDPDVKQYTDDDAKSANPELISKFRQELFRQGMNIAICCWLPSVVHTERDTEIALEVADRAMANL